MFYNNLISGPNAPAPYVQPNSGNPATNPTVGAISTPNALPLTNPPSAPGPGYPGAPGTVTNPKTGLPWQLNPETGRPFPPGVQPGYLGAGSSGIAY